VPSTTLNPTGSSPPPVRPVRVRPALAERAASTPTRFPAASCPTCVSRPSHWAWASGSRMWKTPTPPPTSSSPARQGHPVIEGRRRPGAATSRNRVSSDDFASDPGKYDLPDSVIGFLRGELGDPPGGWPEPFRTAALAGRRPASPPAPLTTRTFATWLSGRGQRSTGSCFKDRPGTSPNTATPTVTFSLLPTREFLYGLQEGAEYAVDLEPGVRPYCSHPGRLRPRRPRMRTVIGTLNRPASPCHRPRPERRGDGKDRRESRPLDPGARCRPVRRHRDPPGD